MCVHVHSPSYPHVTNKSIHNNPLPPPISPPPFSQALQGKDITIYGNGEQTRSFQYVDDLVEGLMRLMNNNYSLPVNIGNPDEYTVKEFAGLIKDLTKSNSTIKYVFGDGCMYVYGGVCVECVWLCTRLYLYACACMPMCMHLS